MKLEQLKKCLEKELKSAILPECSAVPSRASWSSFFSWRNGSFCRRRVSAGWEDGPPLQPVCAAGSLCVWIFFPASLSSVCCGPHSFPACIQSQKNKTLLRITATQDLEDLLLLATLPPFSSQKDTKMSRHKGNQTRPPAMPSPTASRAALTHQEEQEEMAITHKCLKAEHCSKEKTENTTAGEALAIQKREWVKILGSLPSSAPVLQRSPAWA